MSSFVSNLSMANVLQHIDVDFCEDFNTKIYINNGCIILENDEWRFTFEGLGIVRVGNENYPEIEIAYSDRDCCEEDYHKFLSVCKERFLKEAKEMKIDKMVAELISTEEKVYLQAFAKNEISSEEKDRKLLAIYNQKHRMAIREAIMKTT